MRIHVSARRPLARSVTTIRCSPSAARAKSRAALGSARERFALPSDPRSPIHRQRNAARRRHVGIDHVHASRQGRRDAQFAIRRGENRAVAQTVLSALEPIRVFRSELDVASRIVIGRRLRRRQPIGKKFLAHAARIRIGEQFAGERMDVALHDLRRCAIPARAAIRVQVIEDRMENRSRAGHAGNFAHRRAVEISHPDADRKLGRESDRPVVAKVGARSGLAGDRVIEAQAPSSCRKPACARNYRS